MELFTRDGLTFDVQDGGPADGEVVVLLHGFPEDAHSWHRVVPHLQQAGYRTLVPDQRGYSPGAAPRGRHRYTVAALVADIVALLDQVGAFRAHVVGHDWGAGVAWELARRHPERCSSLTAMSVPHPQAVVWGVRQGRQAPRSWYIGAFQLPFVVEQIMGGRMEQGLLQQGMNRDDAAYYGRRWPTPGSLTGPLNWYRALPLGTLDMESRRAPQQVAVPTTYIWGSADPYIDRASAERCGHFVEGAYRFAELDANHWLPQNHAEEVAPLILERLAPGGIDT